MTHVLLKTWPFTFTVGLNMSRKPLPRKLHEEQEEYTDAVVGLCCQCGKPTKGGFYGSWNIEGQKVAGTCNKTCEALYEAVYKYPLSTIG